MSIKIVITREITKMWTAKENVVTKKTPTDKKDRYDGPLYAEEYQLVDVTKTETITHELLKQEIGPDSEFDLAAVIKAINKL